MALPYRERMEREIERLEAARAQVVHPGRQRPDDVRVAIVLGKGQYLAAADRDRYDRLGAELQAVKAKLQAAGVLVWTRQRIGGRRGRDTWRAGDPPYWLIEEPPEHEGDPMTTAARQRHLDREHPDRTGAWELWYSTRPAWRCLSFHPTLESAQAAAQLIAQDPGRMAELVEGDFEEGRFGPAPATTRAVSAPRRPREAAGGGDRRGAVAAAAISAPQRSATAAIADPPPHPRGRSGARDDAGATPGQAPELLEAAPSTPPPAPAAAALAGGDDQVADVVSGAVAGQLVGAVATPAPAALALLDRPDVEDLLARFLARRSPSTIAAYARDLDYFAAWLGLPRRLAVDQLLACDQGQANRLLDHYIAHMRSTPPAARSASSAPRLSPATVNRRLAAVRSLVKMARLHGMVGWTVDVEGERGEPYRDTRGPGLPVVRRMLDGLDEAEGAQRPKAARDRALLRLMWDLGLRRGELVELDLEHFDGDGPRLSVLGKGRSERVWLDLPDQTLEVLDLWLVHRGDEPGPLFCSLGKGGRVRGRRIAGTDVYRAVAAQGQRIGARVQPHAVRHSAITSVLEASGGDRRLGQTFARHRDGRVTDRYDAARANLAGKASRLAASLL